jgi:hypothetical protein
MTITHVQDANLPGADGKTTFVVPIDTTAGNALVAYLVAWTDTVAPASIASVTDSAGNDWDYSTAEASQNPPVSQSDDATQDTYGFTALACCLPSGNGGTTKAVTEVTVVFSEDVYGAITVSEFSGLPAGAVVLGGASDATLASLVKSYTTPAVTASSGSPMLAVVDTSAFNAWSTGISAGWTLIAPNGIAGYNTDAASGSVAATFTGFAQDVPSSAILVIGTPPATTTHNALLAMFP